MDSFVGFYIYAAIFCLAIIAAGIVSIVLGYKLFVLGVMGGEKTALMFNIFFAASSLFTFHSS